MQRELKKKKCYLVKDINRLRQNFSLTQSPETEQLFKKCTLDMYWKRGFEDGKEAMTEIIGASEKPRKALEVLKTVYIKYIL